MKKTYQRPTLIEYGNMQELTRGNIGPQNDYTFNGSVLAISNSSPSCQSNVSSGGCVKIVGG